MDIQVNDIIQIVPEHNWGGCLVVVTELKSWGVQGFIQIPLRGQAYIRLKSDEFEIVGKAVFVLTDC